MATGVDSNYDRPSSSAVKQERKLCKKVAKYAQMILTNEKIAKSATPTKVLAIGNAGLVVGIQREQIFQEFGKYGKIMDVIMIPNQPYSFIIFSTLQGAQTAYDTAFGKIPTDIVTLKVPLCIFYVKEAPKSKNFWFGKLPPGCKLVPDFVSLAEEEELLESVVVESTDLKNRSVSHYGYEFMYGTNNVDINKPLDDNPIPESCDEILKRMVMLGHFDLPPDQLTVNCYLPGQGIPPHIDTHSAFTPAISSLSLGSQVVMEFVNQISLEEIHVLLPRRSLLIMSDEGRYCWTHSIVPRKTDIIPSADQQGLTLFHRQKRTSFTFRKLRKSPCDCHYRSLCDSQKNETENLGMGNSASTLEQAHVHDVYEKIAEHFSETRHKPWPKVEEFILNLSPGSVLLDVGCGNGKYLNINPTTFRVGTDRSSGLLKICSERNFEVFTAEILSLPIKSESVDACICIAVIHHLASEERRQSAIDEITRILRFQGQALIYVWALDQHKNNTKSNYVKQTRNKKMAAEINIKETNVEGLKLPVHVNRTDFQEQDMLVPWHLNKNTTNEKVYQRFYHLFEEGELEKLCRNINGIDVVSSYYDKGNWCIIIQKNK